LNKLLIRIYVKSLSFLSSNKIEFVTKNGNFAIISNFFFLGDFESVFRI
jgi:hypothetical protein